MTNQKPRFRLLFLSADLFPPFRVDVTELFGEEICSRGHVIDWVMQSEEEGYETESVAWKSGQVFLAKTDLGESIFSRLRKHFYSISNDIRSLWRVKSGQYDFIQVKDKFVAAMFAIWIARRTGTKFIYWLSYPFPEASTYEAQVGTARYPLLYRIRGAFFSFVLYRLVKAHAAHVFVQSRQMKQDVCSLGFNPDKVTPVPMGVASSMLESVGGDISLPPGAVVYVGTLLGTRQLDFLVRVLASVLEERPDATLYLVGPEELPGDMDLIEREAERLGVRDKVVMTGGLPREEAFAYIRAADVCVSPFFPTPILNSTSPTKLVEYMGMERPVVANDHPEQSLIIEESHGGICVPYDEERFAAAIVEILKDPALAGDMAISGKQYVLANRTYETIASNVEREYLRLLES